MIEQIEFGSNTTHLIVVQMGGAELDLEKATVLLSSDGSHVHIVGYSAREVIQNLTYRWFKVNYICKDHPEVCEPDFEDDFVRLRM